MLALSGILSESLTSLAKGVPQRLDSVRIADVAQMRLNVLADEFPMPIAVIKEEALQANIDLMATYARAAGVVLAPHGKTTMCPQIFERQLAAGAWGMTCATSNHLRIYRRHGVQKIVFANQLLDQETIQFIAEEVEGDRKCDFYTIVDSIAGARILHAALKRGRVRRKLKVLLEVGVMGGRTGVRTVGDAVAVVREIARHSDCLSLCGLEVFEGVVQGTPEEGERGVRRFIARVAEFARRVDEEGIFLGSEVILSAGGSAYFDIVVEMLRVLRLSRATRVMLRAGCYVTHDHGFYADAMRCMQTRASATSCFSKSAFEPALEVWSKVQSIPEPGLALLSVGKRDLSMDMGLPMVIKVYRQETHQIIEAREIGRISLLNDHHAYLRHSGISLAVGDLVCLGVSHPCTTFDRWPYLYLTNRQYEILSVLKTFF